MKLLFSTFCMLILISPMVWSNQNPIVNVCDDAAEFPPYIYYQREGGVKDPDKVNGAMIDVLAEITKLTGLEFSVKLLPWSRCLFEIEKKDNFEMYMNGIYTKERSNSAYITTPVYTMSRGYWYSTKKYPEGLSIDNLADLRSYKMIGLHGWSYETYGITKEEEVLSGAAKNFEDAFKMLKRNRGDILLGGYRVVHGFETIGRKITPEDVEWRRITNAPRSEFHIFISKRSPRAYELFTKINQAIIVLNAERTIDKVLKRHMPCGQHC